MLEAEVERLRVINDVFLLEVAFAFFNLQNEGGGFAMIREAAAGGERESGD